MGGKFNQAAELLAELDIALVSALYRAAGEPDAYENLVATLEQRYQPESPAAGGRLRLAVERELGQISNIVDEQGSGLSRDPLERAVEEVPTAAIVIDPHGKVILTNELGKDLFAALPDQVFDFELVDPAYRTQFRDFVASARLRGNQRRIIVRLDTTRGSDAADAPTPVELAEAMIVETARRDHGCIALRSLEIPWTAKIDSQLAEAFGLTRAECEISRQFYVLRDTRLVAAQRGTSLATIQTQLKSIFAKTRTSSQAQLLQVLSLLCARANLDKTSQLSVWANPFGREATFTRSDGKEIAYSWQGAKNGKPVLVIHGQSLGHMFPPEAERLYRQAGLKLFILSRPGFGHSEINPKLRAMDDHALAIREFCQHLNIRGAPALTISSGLVGLSRALERDAELVSSIANVGYLWNNDVEITGRLPTQQRIIFYMARHAPALLRVVVSIAYRNIKRQGVDWYIDRLLGGIRVDESYFRSGRNAGLIRSAAGHLLIQGSDVYCRELQQPLDPWLTPMRQSSLPILFALPEHDSIHDFDEYVGSLKLGPEAGYSKLLGVGELYFYKAAEEIAKLTIRHFAETAPGYEACSEAITEPIS